MDTISRFRHSCLSRSTASRFVGLLVVSLLCWQFGLLPGTTINPVHAAPPTDCTGVTEIPAAECSALIALYSSTNGASWTDHSGWNTTHPCTAPWYGVTCASGHVTLLRLYSNGLIGPLSSLSNLTKLILLDLNGNQLSGAIPSMSGLTSLTYLDLNTNQLSGTIPSLNILPSLNYIDLSHNQLTGTIPALSGMVNLTDLYLGQNQLSGAIPSLSGLTALQTVLLYQNQLTGTIPSLSGLTGLQSLWLFNNQLSSAIPSLSGLTNFQQLLLDHNQLTGSIPALSSVTGMHTIQLDHNQLSGTIPALTALTGLKTLQLNQNQLTGTIPDVPASLTSLFLFSNLLTGIIPVSLTNTLIGVGELSLCGTGNMLTPADSNVDAFITARDLTWIGQCDGRHFSVTGFSSPVMAGTSGTVTVTALNGLNSVITGYTGMVQITSTDLQAALPANAPLTNGVGAFNVTLNTPGSRSITATDTVVATTTGAQTSISVLSGKRTIGIYRNGTFLLRLHNSTGFADLSVAFHPGTLPYPIVGDWVGNGYDSVGVFDRSNGLFSLCTFNDSTLCANSANVHTLVLGNPNDTPLSGRWQSSATNAGVGVFRPSNGLIYLKNALTTGFANFTMVLGIPGDAGLAGDWNGDGPDSPGVYRPSISTFFLTDQVCNCSATGSYQFGYGVGGDAPVVGDWTGLGHAGVGLFRQTNGFTYLRNSLTTGFADNTFTFGIAGDVPVAGHWQLVYPPLPNPASVLIPPTVAPVPTGSGLGDGANGSLHD